MNFIKKLTKKLVIHILMFTILALLIITVISQRNSINELKDSVSYKDKAIEDLEKINNTYNGLLSTDLKTCCEKAQKWDDYSSWYEKQLNQLNYTSRVTKKYYSLTEYIESIQKKTLNSDFSVVSKAVVNDIYNTWVSEKTKCFYYSPETGQGSFDLCSLDWIFNYKQSPCNDYTLVIAAALTKVSELYDDNKLVRVLEFKDDNNKKYTIPVVQTKNSNLIMVVDGSNIIDGTPEEVWGYLSKKYNNYNTIHFVSILDNNLGYCDTYSHCNEIIPMFDPYSLILK